jgi:hypothetical protein
MLELQPLCPLAAVAGLRLAVGPETGRGDAAAGFGSLQQLRQLLASLSQWPTHAVAPAAARCVRVVAIRGPNMSQEAAALSLLTAMLLRPAYAPLLPSLLPTPPSASLPGADSRSASAVAGHSSADPARPRGLALRSVQPAGAAAQRQTSQPWPLALSATRKAAIVAEHVARFKLNGDQAALLRRCCAWLQAREEALADGAGTSAEHAGGGHAEDAAAPAFAPLVLCHGCFGSGKSWNLVALISCLCALLDESEGRETKHGALASSAAAREPVAAVTLASSSSPAASPVSSTCSASSFSSSRSGRSSRSSGSSSESSCRDEAAVDGELEIADSVARAGVATERADAGSRVILPEGVGYGDDDDFEDAIAADQADMEGGPEEDHEECEYPSEAAESDTDAGGDELDFIGLGAAAASTAASNRHTTAAAPARGAKTAAGRRTGLTRKPLASSAAAAAAEPGATQGTRPRPQCRILVAASTNTAVDRVLAGLLEAGFEDFSRVGAAKKIEPSLLGHLLPHSDREEAIRHALRELTDVLQGMGGHPGMLAPAPAAAAGEHCGGDGAGLDLARRCAPVLAALRQLGDRRAVLDRLQSSRVVGTTCAAAAFPILQGLSFPIVVLDEASQMPEPTSATPLARFGSRFAVVVGDPLQLPPVLQSPPVADLPAGAAAGSASATTSSSSSTLEGSTLFTRLAACGGAPLVALRTQYRCHPRLGDLASRLFYGGSLTSGVLPWQRGPRVRLLPPLALFDYSNLTAAEWARAGGGAAAAHAAASSAGSRLASGPPFPPAALGTAVRFGDAVGRADAGRSLFNAGEAALVAALVASLLGRGTPAGDVGVICLYRAQVFRVRDCLAALGIPVRLTGTEGDRAASRFAGAGGPAAALGGGGGAVTVATVDAYQGAEKPIIILSPTRTSPCATAAAGGPAASATASGAAEASPAATAFADNPQRLNVALTRAKNHLLIVCHARALATYPLWRRIISTVLSDGAVPSTSAAGAEAVGAAVARPSFRSAGMPDMLAPVAASASGIGPGAGAGAPAAVQPVATTRCV